MALEEAHPGVFNEVWNLAWWQSDWTARPAETLRQACQWAEQGRRTSKAVSKAFAQGIVLYGPETDLLQGS